MQMILEDYRDDLNAEVAYPPVALGVGYTQYGDKKYPIPLVTYGNFAFIYAQPKTKKTFLASLLASCYMEGEQNSTNGVIQGYRDGKELLWVDTEQGQFHANRTFKRVKDLCSTFDNDKFKGYPLRAVSHSDRINFIEYYLEQANGELGLVIIDGIADLVSDVNDLRECNDVVQKLLTWTALYKCAIITIVHSNHGSDKPTGHLGSALEKKAETQIRLEAKSVDLNTKDDKSIVQVTCKRSRNSSFEPFSFKINSDSLPEIIDTSYEFN
ncbi:MAG: AAA family ATPase [Candidatus Heimdallarchaeaceae archaeon]